MIFAAIFMGLIEIGAGFLVRYYPNLIAGYNTMPPERKKNVDIEGLSRFMRNCLVTMGLATIITPGLLAAFGLYNMTKLFIVLPTLAGTVYVLIGAQKYDHN